VFALDPESLVARARAATPPPRVPGRGESVVRGMIGFTLVSLGGFAPWMIAGRWLHRTVGEVGLYTVCAITFIGLSSPLLHQLIIGPGSRSRFYQLFSPAFLAYAVIWTTAWMTLARATGGMTAGIIGALAGTAAMGALLVCGFKAPEALWRVIAGLFIGNVAGYFIGELAYHGIHALKDGNAAGFVLAPQTRSWLSKSAWGLCYGLGFGAGIGFAFHTCQARARTLLASQA